MSSKRVTRSSNNLSPDFQGLMENLHGPSQQSSYVAPEHTTLAEASKQDVDKLLGRANARGAAARAKGSAKPITAKRGRKNVFPEGEESLFYQRNVKGDVGPTGNLLMCGASASTMADVKYGSSSEHNAYTQSSCEAMEHDMPEVSMHGLDVLKEVEELGLKSDDALDERSSMEDGCEWELESTVLAGSDQDEEKPWDGNVNIEIDMNTPNSSEKKTRKRNLRRANAKDKEFAELVHKAHLLCMIARGRLVDAACNDPILQASLLSIVPDHIHFHDTQRVSVSELGPFVKWFQSTFQVHADKGVSDEVPVREDVVSCLLDALHKQAGSSEEVAALSVSLLRALDVTARFVTVLDVLSLKPDSSSLEASTDWDADNGSFSQRLVSAKLASSSGQNLYHFVPQTLAMAVTNASSSPTVTTPSSIRRQSSEGRMQKQEMTRKNSKNGKQVVEDSLRCKTQKKRKKKIKFESSNNLHVSDREDVRENGTNTATDVCDIPGSEKKRKGDLEFELQLAMAMAATAATTIKSQVKVLKKLEIKDELEESKSPATLEKGKGLYDNSVRPMASGSAVWSRKLGPLLNWAEVFCLGKDSERWVHVDAGRGLLDGADLVEEAARSCRVPLRYVLAFAGNRAKDVTRRYVTLWSAVAPLRVSNDWWNITLAPLKEPEAGGTSLDSKQEDGTVLLGNKVGAGSIGSSSKAGSSSRQSQANDQNSLEDMELDIRACTEPLPKNQQAYRNHHLYALERWLTKYQGLHPRGPILGYCAGHPVFPRACVQDLHTAERWLREGLKVRPHELPAKIVKNLRLVSNQIMDDSPGVGEGVIETPTTALFGKWQTEPWYPPPAVDGIVPKNERGNVELWSEKCLPPGTVHISLPRILLVAKKLEIDFAPALVGFEIRNRRSVPVFEGIVVCQEHENILLEAYAEEEYRRNIEAEKKREILAVARWCQLLRSVTVRQRLQATYQISQDGPHRSPADDEVLSETVSLSENQVSNHEENNKRNHTSHEHLFLEQNQRYDEQSGIRTKICACGFTLTIEEL